MHVQYDCTYNAFLASPHRKGPRMYHVLIFNKEGRFHLDSDGEQGEDPITFVTMDETVSFLIGHHLKVNEEEIHLQDILPCDDELMYRVRISSNGTSRFTIISLYQNHHNFFQLQQEIPRMLIS